MPNVTTGLVEAIDPVAQTIQVSDTVFRVDPLMLTQLAVGQRVTVSWNRAGDSKQALTIAIDSP